MEIDNPPQMMKQEEITAVELPAPPGWKKKLTPKKGGTPKRNEIVFISPTSEEIKTKKQLELYLKSHSGGPSPSEFDWGTGETPRRSARLSEKTKATESPENETPKKKERKSVARKGSKGKNDDDEEEGQASDENKDDAHEGKGTAEETNLSAEVPTADAEHAAEPGDVQIVTEKILTDKDDTVEAEQKTEDKITAEELGIDKNTDVKLQTSATENENKDQVENQEGSKNSSDANKGAESLPSTEPKDSEKEAESKPAEAEACEAASAGRVSDAHEHSASKKADVENTDGNQLLKQEASTGNQNLL